METVTPPIVDEINRFEIYERHEIKTLASGKSLLTLFRKGQVDVDAAYICESALAEELIKRHLQR